jgi:hypothetical protein
MDQPTEFSDFSDFDAAQSEAASACRLDKAEFELAGCLRRLFRIRYVLRTRNEKWFRIMIEHRVRIENAVKAFAVRLEINEPLGVIFLKPIDDETEEQLGIRFSLPHSLSPLATTLMIHLRWLRLQFYLQPTDSDVPIVEMLELREFSQQFTHAKIDQQFERQFRRALDELRAIDVIFETAAESGFFEISSLCDLLLPADQIHDLRVRATAYFAHKGGAFSEKTDEVIDA